MTRTVNDSFEDMVPIGKVIKPHGLRGEVKVKAQADPSILGNLEDVLLYDPKSKNTVRTSIEAIRPSGEGFIILFKGFNSIGIAEKIRGYQVSIKKASLPPLKDGEYYFFQLMGCSVYNENGDLLGKVDDIIETGANDVIVIRRKLPDLSIKEDLIPIIKDYVVEMNLAEKKLVVKTMNYEDSGETR